MKNNKINSWLFIGMITIGSLATSTALAGNIEGKSIDENRLSTRKEYKDMKATLNRISDDQKRIDFHKAALKTNKQNGLVIESHMSKKELLKAKADLRRDKKFLKIDRKDLKNDQKVAIKAKRKAVCEDKKNLRSAKSELRKDLRQGNVSELDGDVEQIQIYTKVVESHQQESAKLEDDVDDFFALLDEEIDTTFNA